MLFPVLAAVAILLPFGAREPLFHVGALGFDLPLTAAAVAAAVSFAYGLRRNVRFDALDWSVIALVAAWFLSALASTADSPKALGAAWRMSLGPVIFVFARSLLPSRDRRRLLAVLAAGAGLAIAWKLAAGGIPSLPPSMAFNGTADLALFAILCACAGLPLAGLRGRNAGIAVAIGFAATFLLAAILRGSHEPLPAWPSGKPLLGWGPGSRHGLPLWATLPAETGLVGSLAAVAAFWFALRLVLPLFHRRPRTPEPWAAAGVAAVFIAAGILRNPLHSLPCSLASWLALAVLLPPPAGSPIMRRRA